MNTASAEAFLKHVASRSATCCDGLSGPADSEIGPPEETLLLCREEVSFEASTRQAYELVIRKALLTREDAHCAVPIRGGEERGVRIEVDASHRRAVAGEDGDTFTCSRAQDAGSASSPAVAKAAVATERRGLDGVGVTS